MSSILTVSLGWIDTFINYRFFKCYLYKNNKIKNIVIIFACSFISTISSVINIVYQIPLLNLAISIISVALMSLLFIGSVIRKLLISAIYIIFSIIIEFIVTFTIGVFFGIQVIVIANNSYLTYVALVFVILIKFNITYLLNKYKNRKGILSTNYYLLLMIIPILSVVMIAYFFFDQLGRYKINYIYCNFFLYAILFFNLTLYLIYEKLEDLYIEKLKNNDIMQDLKYKEFYYSQLESHQKEIRMLRHDMKNQLMAIKGYFEEKNYNQAETELKTIIYDILEGENTSYTKNPSLNAILNYKNSEIRKKNINNSFEINMPESFNMSGRNIGILVGNILDNAIEACENCISDRFIKLILCYYNHSIVLYCENSIDGKNRNLKTKKEDKLNHGLGLKSLEKIIQAYNGTMESTFTDNTFIISVNLWNV